MLLPLTFAGCMNDNFDEPNADSLNYKAYSGAPVNTTIKQLLDTYATTISNNSYEKVKTGVIIEGTVVSSDANGNFYQTLVIQDATGGIQVSLSQKGLHIYYPVGQKIVINCDSLYIGGYGKSAELGTQYYNTTKAQYQIGRLNETVWENSATPDGIANTANLPAAAQITKYTDLSTANVNTLVTLKNVSFDNAHYQAFAPQAEQDGGYAVDRNITFSDGSYIVVRTSSYANFANTPLPGGTGDLIGIMGYYNGTYQFTIRDYNADLSSSFEKYSSIRIPLYSETFASSLGKMTAQHETNATVTDISDWSYSSSYNCAMISGYDSSNKVNKAVISYLVSPTVDLTNLSQAFVSFSGAIAYADVANADANHALLISTDYTGDPTTATWTDLPYTKSPSASGSFNFTNSGKVGIPNAFIGKKVTFALRYKSTTSKASTWEVKNFMVDEGKGEITLFSSSLLGTNAGFTSQSITGSQSWNLNTTYGFTVTGFANNVKNANEDWAVSPEIDLTGADAPAISFNHTINKGDGTASPTYHTLWITDNYTGDVSTTQWTQINIPNYPTGTNWTFVSSGKALIPTAFLNKKVRIAFKYLSTTSVADTWEIKTLVVK